MTIFFKRVFGHFKLNTVQKHIVDSCIQENEEEYSKWYFLNIFVPVIFLIISAIFVFFYQKGFENVLKIFLNGSLSILGISIICSMSSYLIGKRQFDDKELNKEVVNLSEKLSNYGYLVIAFGAVLYIVQTVLLPSSLLYRLAILLLVLITLSLSIQIGVRSFIIRDDFYENSIERIYEEAKNTSNRVSDFKNKLKDEDL